MSEYIPIIGLEVHVQLKTKSKLFCSCPVEFGAKPNKNICPICTGQPGVLPVLNKTAVEYAIISALALNCKINKTSIFARKHYFYPDLPKNYQISQYETPLAYDGNIEIELKDGNKKNIRIKRLHLEEDAGKLLHQIGSIQLDYSLVDFNRCGTPLLEIVSQPDMNSPEEAYSFLSNLRAIMRYIGVSDCEMEKGSLRCDANISLLEKGQEIKYGVKTEIKNMNSFKAVKEALEYEIKRQTELKNKGIEMSNETRLFEADKKITLPMREKEEAHDYRYFPEPDLPPLVIEDETIKKLKSILPELPNQKKQRFKTQYELSDYDAMVLTSEKEMANFFEETLKLLTIKQPTAPKITSNWITTELLGKLNAENKTIEESLIKPKDLAQLVELILKNEISTKIAKSVFNEMYTTGKNPYEIVKEKSLIQISDKEQLTPIIEEVINLNKKIVEEYLSGKEKAIGALIGEVMKKTSGKANPSLVNEILKEKINAYRIK